MARSPRRRRITPLSTDEPETEENETSQEGDDTEDSEHTDTSDEAEEPTQETQEETPMAQAPEPVTSDEFDSFLQALDKLSMEQLITVIDTAQEKRAAKQEETRNLLLEQFREQARKAGMSFESLFPTATRGRQGSESTVAPRFRGPNGELYSGRGQSPRWMQVIIAEGKYKKEDFFIQPNGKTEYEMKNSLEPAGGSLV